MRTSSILFSAAAALLAAACGPETPAAQTPGGAGSGSAAAAKVPAGDVSFDVAPSELAGIVFEPHALGRPGIPTVKAKGDNGKKPPTDGQVDKQRKTLASTKDPVLKEANAEILASMLYRQSAVAQPGAETDAKLNEARQVLADFAASAGDKVDDTTWWMLASYQILAGDFAASEKSWAAAVAKAPTAENAPMWRAWWAYALLMQGKNADALAVVKDQTLSDKQPELAYAAAWARWRTGDALGAWQAIMVAAKGWGTSANKDIVINDALLFAARANVGVDDAVTQLTPIFGTQPNQKIDLLSKIGLQAFRFAGRWADAIAADDKTAALPGVPPNLIVSLRFSQGDAAVKLDEPDVVAKFALAAIAALPACGDKCNDTDKQNVIVGVFGIAARFHLVYSTSNDQRYHEAAVALYAAATPLIADAKIKAQAVDYSANLDKTYKNMKVGTGTHDKEAISWLLKQHDQEIQSCYEATLGTNAKLGGTLTVNLEVDQTGAIKGVATEPKAGLADLAAVASCAADHAKAWKLPKRGMAGTTRIKLTYSLSPKAAKS